MKHVTIRYDSKTHRVTQSYWRDGTPTWVNEKVDGEEVVKIETTERKRTEVLKNALNSVEAGTDYDPDTETPVGKLCYDPDNDELYVEVEIRSLQE